MKTATSRDKVAGSGQHDNDLPKISQPALRALASVGIQRLDQLTKFSETELKQLHGMGPKALGILHQALSERGLSFSKEKRS